MAGCGIHILVTWDNYHGGWGHPQQNSLRGMGYGSQQGINLDTPLAALFTLHDVGALGKTRMRLLRTRPCMIIGPLLHLPDLYLSRLTREYISRVHVGATTQSLNAHDDAGGSACPGANANL